MVFCLYVCIHTRVYIHTVRARLQDGSSIFHRDIFGGLVIEFSLGGLILERVLYFQKEGLVFSYLHKIPKNTSNFGFSSIICGQLSRWSINLCLRIKMKTII